MRFPVLARNLPTDVRPLRNILQQLLTYSMRSCDVGQVISVDTLPDDILLAVFDYHVNDYSQHLTVGEKAWQSLVHVCRRWRSIVFASPRHLNLQLVCKGGTPAKDALDIWPALPLIIWCFGYYRTGSVDNIIAVLERRGRVRQITLADVQSSDLEILLTAMQQPFSELTHLSLHCLGKTVPVDPDLFLGGSAQRLEYLLLEGIPFPGLPKLLFVCFSPRQTSPFRYSPFRVHLTRCDGHCPLLVDQPFFFFAQIPIPSILPRQSKPTPTSLDTHCSPHSHEASV